MAGDVPTVRFRGRLETEMLDSILIISLVLLVFYAPLSRALKNRRADKQPRIDPAKKPSTPDNTPKA